MRDEPVKRTHVININDVILEMFPVFTGLVRSGVAVDPHARKPDD